MPVTDSDSVAQDMIAAFFERWQRLEEEKVSIGGDLKELFAEAKANGFNTKVLRAVFRDKVADEAERTEFEAVYDLYWSVLGTPFATGARPAHEDEPEHDAETGEVIEPEAAMLPQTGAAETLVTNSPPVNAAAARGNDGDPTSSAGTEGEADRQPIPPSAARTDKGISPAEGVVFGQGGEMPPPTNITPLHRFNPATHFANSKGLPRLHGCTRPEACGGSHRALCHLCIKPVAVGGAA